MKKELCLFLSGVVLAGCSRPEPKEEPAPGAAVKPVIAALNYPLAYFAERLAGPAATVAFPVPAGEDPAYWMPAEADIATYQRANLILDNGADYSQWLRTATLPEDRRVDTSRAFADRYLRNAHTVTHSHGPEGAHEHGVTDFNTWLDPRQALQQAEAVRAALARRWPGEQAAIAGRFKALADDLKALDAELELASQAWGARPLLASHPVYGYLARRYAWKLESVHWEPGEVPPDEEWGRLEALLKTHPATVMIWEADPLPAVAARLKSLGVACVVFHPCGNRPPAGDYLSEMRANAARLRQAAGPPSP